jgi:hypothetical protein
MCECVNRLGFGPRMPAMDVLLCLWGMYEFRRGIGSASPTPCVRLMPYTSAASTKIFKP